MVLTVRDAMTFKDRRIAVVGLARSGTGAANILLRLGARVLVVDKKPRELLEEAIRRLDPAVSVIAGEDAGQVPEDVELIVISPGVPLSSPQLDSARVRGIPVIGELELAYQIVQSAGAADGTGARPDSEIISPCFIGITGTNGKSTTTTLVDLMVREAGYRSVLGGNIGTALTEALMKEPGPGASEGESHAPVIGRHVNTDYIVAEISSFQLETITCFRPRIAVILNLTEDHLNRYSNMREYEDAKARIFENQTSGDLLIANADDAAVMKMIGRKRKGAARPWPELLYFSREKEVNGVYCKDGAIFVNIPRSVTSFPVPDAHSLLIAAQDIRVRGVHNLENAMAAVLTAVLSGCPADAVRKVLQSFPGLEHRLELVGEKNGISYINDSKATNVGAVAMSLSSFRDIILIMGGLDKGSDFTVLRGLVRERVKLLILLGQARDKIQSVFRDIVETCGVRDLREAVRVAHSRAVSDDVVLLAPGCASFDMFRDFEDRGRKFREAVQEVLSKDK